MLVSWSKIANFNLPHLYLAIGAHAGGDPAGISSRCLAPEN